MGVMVAGLISGCCLLCVGVDAPLCGAIRTSLVMRRSRLFTRQSSPRLYKRHRVFAGPALPLWATDPWPALVEFARYRLGLPTPRDHLHEQPLLSTTIALAEPGCKCLAGWRRGEWLIGG